MNVKRIDMMTFLSESPNMDVLTTFRKSRAFREGQDAWREGAPRKAPIALGEFAQEWIRGWDAKSTTLPSCTEWLSQSSPPLRFPDHNI